MSKYTNRAYMFGKFQTQMDCEFYQKVPGNTQEFGYITMIEGGRCISLFT